VEVFDDPRLAADGTRATVPDFGETLKQTRRVSPLHRVRSMDTTLLYDTGIARTGRSCGSDTEYKAAEIMSGRFHD
jgi:hypothetical protein